MPTITNTQLHKLIKPVLPFASKDYSLPILAAVHFTESDGKLTTMATDRYRLGRVRLPEVDADGFTATLGVKAIRHVLGTFKASAKGGSVSLSVNEAGNVVLEGETGAEWGAVRLEIPQATREGQKYPPISSLFSKAEDRAVFAKTALNGHYLAEMGAVVAATGSPLPVVVQVSDEANAPILFNHEGLGAEFTGLLMPLRIPKEG